MLVTISRNILTDKSSIGRWTMDWNPFSCFTIENVDRGITVNTPLADIMHLKQLYTKVDSDGVTGSDVAIPTGIHQLVMSFSPKFGKLMPQIITIGFQGVRVHIANKPEDVIGCVGVGAMYDSKTPDWLSNSAESFNQLYPILFAACSQGEVMVNIVKQLPTA